MVPMGSTTTPCEHGAAARQSSAGWTPHAVGLSPLWDFLSSASKGISFFFPSDLLPLTLRKGKITRVVGKSYNKWREGEGVALAQAGEK